MVPSILTGIILFSINYLFALKLFQASFSKHFNLGTQLKIELFQINANDSIQH